MIAVPTREARPVPRLLFRIFWALHRAIYRVTGGSLGLQRPVTGQKSRAATRLLPTSRQGRNNDVPGSLPPRDRARLAGRGPEDPATHISVRPIT